MKRRVLVVCYHFPPDPSVGSLRPRGLARYLPDYGWEPVFLVASRPEAAPDHDQGRRIVRAHDPGETSVLLKRRLGFQPERSFQEQLGVSRGLRESRDSWSKRLFYVVKAALVVPDDMLPWARNAIREGRRLLERERFDLILSSSPPQSVNLVARALQRSSGLPWVADLRDLWTQNHQYPYGPLRRLCERPLEWLTLRSATRLVTVSEPLAARLRTLHRVPARVIENGFDPLERVPALARDSEFTIVYTGRLFDQLDPGPLLRVLGRLLAAGRLDRARVRVQFYGDAPLWLERERDRLGLQGVVELAGRVPRELALERQRAAQLLLFLSWLDPRERGGVYTGKLFEYLAAERPILALGPGGDVVERLIVRSRTGTYCVGEAAVEEALLEAWDAFERSGTVPYQGLPEEIERFEHPRMARRFAEVLEAACVDAR